MCGHGPSSKALRAAAQAAFTSASAASGTLPTSSPVAGECTSMTSEVDGSTHLPPMNSLSHSVLKAVLCVMGVTLPRSARNENLFQFSDSRRPQDQHQIAHQELPQHRNARHPPCPSRVVAGKCGDQRAGARRPIAARRRPTPRTTTIRSRSSVDARACGHSARRRGRRRGSGSDPSRGRRTGRATPCTTAPPGRRAW